MSERVRALAETFDRANADFIAAVEALSEAEWPARCEPEGWSVAATVWHVGSAHARIAGYVRAVASGQPPAITRAQVDEINDREAAEHAACGRDEAIALVRREGDAAAQLIRTLTDEQLGRAGAVFRQAPWTLRTDEVIERILIAHVVEHHRSIRATTAT
jgi:uncharacterized damage-inducible protein DinB